MVTNSGAGVLCASARQLNLAVGLQGGVNGGHGLLLGFCEFCCCRMFVGKREVVVVDTSALRLPVRGTRT